MAFLCGKSVKSPDGMRYPRTSEKPQIHPNSSKFTWLRTWILWNTMKYYEILWKEVELWMTSSCPPICGESARGPIPTFCSALGFTTGTGGSWHPKDISVVEMGDITNQSLGDTIGYIAKKYDLIGLGFIYIYTYIRIICYQSNWKQKHNSVTICDSTTINIFPH